VADDRHWRQMMEESPWLTHIDLLDKDGKPREFNVTIESVKEGQVTGEGGKKQTKPVLRFKGARKPYAAGATVCETISAIVGSPKPRLWIGQRITLYVTTTEITRTIDGKKTRMIVGCIRVRPKAPSGPDAPLPTTPSTELPDDTESGPAGGADAAR
jgi:hypothetical protein